jgi:hypothetical protein
MVSLAIADGGGGAPLIDASELVGALVRFRTTGKFDPVPEVEGGLPDPFARARELAELWGGKRYLIERTEMSQLKNRAEALATLLRNKSVKSHLKRLDHCITEIASLLPQASADRVAAWKQVLVRVQARLEAGAEVPVEDLIVELEGPELPEELPFRLGWLARAPARDLEDLLTAAQTGEKAIEGLRDHARDCVREAGGTESLTHVRRVGTAMREAARTIPTSEASK